MIDTPQHTSPDYAFGYSPTAVAMMSARSAEENAGFMLVHLKPGMRVLDIGCGPGSITVGLAAAVAPGEVTGIDIEPSQVELGRKNATDRGLDNCRFEVASVYELPFNDSSVDAVFGHTILMQFSDPETVLAEVRRALRPGGLIGFCEIDFGANLYHSEESAVRQVLFTLRRSIRHNGGNPDIGRSLPGIIAGAGFDLVSISAKYNAPTTPEAKARQCATMKRLWQDAAFVDKAEELGWIDADLRVGLPARLDREASDPASFSASTYVEVVAQLPESG
jgi:SAM-dependent methyltransferase